MKGVDITLDEKKVYISIDRSLINTERLFGTLGGFKEEYDAAVQGKLSRDKQAEADNAALRDAEKRRKHDVFSAISHFIGALLSVAGLVLLVVFAAVRGEAWHVVSFSIFGASLILMYMASSLYHIFPFPSKVKSIFRKIDHSMIFVLIAGTYTPVCLVALNGPWGWSLFGVIWGLAILGIVFKSIGKVPKLISTLNYILMGWMAVIAFYPLMQALPIDGLLWLFGGGVFYTVGTIFYSMDKKFPSQAAVNYHDIFHLFILAGSFCHFWLMLSYVLKISVTVQP